MKDHRRTHARLPKNAHLDNFDAADALESLHTEIAQLEAFAHAAGEVITRLSPPSDLGQRREYRRLYTLVTRVAQDAVTVVNRGDELIAALSAHLEIQ